MFMRIHKDHSAHALLVQAVKAGVTAKGVTMTLKGNVVEVQCGSRVFKRDTDLQRWKAEAVALAGQHRKAKEQAMFSIAQRGHLHG